MTRALHPQASGLSLEATSVKPCEKLPESISIRRASAIALRAGEANNVLAQNLVSVLPLLNSELDFSVRDRVDPTGWCCGAGAAPWGQQGSAAPQLLPKGCPGDLSLAQIRWRCHYPGICSRGRNIKQIFCNYLFLQQLV